MKTLLNPWFIAGCLVWLLVFVTRRIGHPLPYVNGYLSDAFALPVIANLGLWFQRVFIVRNNRYLLTPWHVLFVVVYVSIVFEWILPSISKKFTADWIDVLLYTIGGVFFYLVMNKEDRL
jgi:hypothetical protein